VYPAYPFHGGAVAAAKEAPICLYAVADDPNTAVLAARGESVDCTLETIEGVRVATSHSHLEAFVVPHTGNKRADTHSRCREIDVQELVDGEIVLRLLMW
jgi:hypothetical protein